MPRNTGTWCTILMEGAPLHEIGHVHWFGEFLTYIMTIAVVLLGEAAMTWVLRKVVWRGIQSTVVVPVDAEALLGRWHRGWRLWCPRFSSFVIIAAIPWVVIPRPQTAGRLTAAKGVHRVIDKGVNAVKNRMPEGNPNSQRIKNGLDRGGEKAKLLASPKKQTS